MFEAFTPEQRRFLLESKLAHHSSSEIKEAVEERWPTVRKYALQSYYSFFSSRGVEKELGELRELRDKKLLELPLAAPSDRVAALSELGVKLLRRVRVEIERPKIPIPLVREFRDVLRDLKEETGKLLGEPESDSSQIMERLLYGYEKMLEEHPEVVLQLAQMDNEEPQG